MLKGHHVLWILLALAALWIFHVHYNRGVPIKSKG